MTIHWVNYFSSWVISIIEIKYAIMQRRVNMFHKGFFESLNNKVCNVYKRIREKKEREKSENNLRIIWQIKEKRKIITKINICNYYNSRHFGYKYVYSQPVHMIVWFKECKLTILCSYGTRLYYGNKHQWNIERCCDNRRKVGMK